MRNAAAQVQPQVTLAVDTANPSPGDTITFSAAVTGTDITTVVLTDGGNIEQADDSAPYEWTFNLSISASGAATFKVVALIDDTVVESNSVTVTVLPDLSGLQQLVFEPGRPLVLFPGTTKQLRVIGRFSDGHNRELTQSAMGTI